MFIADEVQTAPFQVFATALGVGEKRIAAVDDYVAFLEQRRELVDDCVHRRTGLDHDHRLPWSLQRGEEFLHRARRHDIFPLGLTGCKLVGHIGGPVKNGHGKSLRFHVEDEVLAHDGQADQSDITLLRAHFKYLLGHA